MSTPNTSGTTTRTPAEIAREIVGDVPLHDAQERVLAERITRAITEAVDAEREACARVADKAAVITGVAERIRARGGEGR